MQAIEHEADTLKHLHIITPQKLVTVIDKAAKRTFSSRSRIHPARGDARAQDRWLPRDRWRAF